jgi:shikimate kinase
VRIFLVGFMGAGKSTVGALLARELGVPFLDLDAEIEAAAGRSIRDLFAAEGEQGFRQREHEALVRLLAYPDAVIATGGGTLTVDASAELMARSGLTVWLNPAFVTIALRIGHSGKVDRPLFRDEAQALQLYRQRLPLYQRADWTIDVGAEETPEEIVGRLRLRLAELDRH